MSGVIFFLLFICIAKINSDCIKDPGSPSCVDYKIPDDTVNNYISQLCWMMYMPECSIRTLCENNQGSGIYCDPFSIYKNLCNDMQMMGCESYVSMCLNASSVVRQCNADTLELNYFTVRQNIDGICSRMYMSDCSKCQQMTCNNSLITYSNLCLKMPDMPECSDWKTMCTKIPTWSVCADNTINPTPEMRMYFHTGFIEYILFAQWVPYNMLSYMVSLIAVFLMAFLHEGLKVIKVYFEAKNIVQNEDDSMKTVPSYNVVLTQQSITYPPFDCKRDILRALYRGIDITAHFMIMLITMTFNVGLFVAVIFGYMCGHFVFVRFTHLKNGNHPADFVTNVENCH